MSLNKIITIFVIILIIFAGIVFYQFSTKSKSATGSKQTSTKQTNQQTTKYDTGKVTIGKQTFNVELAKTPAQQELGLSNRNSLDEDHGMLFLFPSAGYYSFWMKDMKFPIDIIFMNNNKIVKIFDNVPAPKSAKDRLPTYTPDAPANTVLEINTGLAKKDGFKKGDTVTVSQ